MPKKENRLRHKQGSSSARKSIMCAKASTARDRRSRQSQSDSPRHDAPESNCLHQKKVILRLRSGSRRNETCSKGGAGEPAHLLAGRGRRPTRFAGNQPRALRVPPYHDRLAPVPAHAVPPHGTERLKRRLAPGAAVVRPGADNCRRRKAVQVVTLRSPTALRPNTD